MAAREAKVLPGLPDQHIFFLGSANAKDPRAAETGYFFDLESGHLSPVALRVANRRSSSSVQRRTAGRWGSGMACVGPHVFIFGGGDTPRRGVLQPPTNDTYVFDTRILALSLLDCSGSVPAPRWGHTLSPVGSRLYMFGGALAPHIFSNDLFIFETGMMQWREVQAKGDWPARRTGHATAIVGSKVYLFGGMDEQGRLLNDLYILHTTGSGVRWEQVVDKKGRPPSGRMGHTLTAVGTRLFVLGGALNSPANGPLHEPPSLRNERSFISSKDLAPILANDLHVFDIVTQTWRQVDLDKCDSIGVPRGRAHHAAAVWRTTIVTVGGILDEEYSPTSAPTGAVTLIDTQKVTFADPAPDTLRDDLLELFTSGQSSDLTFIVQGQPVTAHRCVLGVRMPQAGLTALLTPEFRSEVVVDGCTVESFKAIMTLLYSDRTRVLSLNSDVFARLAARYHLHERLAQVGFFPLDSALILPPTSSVATNEQQGSLASDMRKLFALSLVETIDESSNNAVSGVDLLALRDITFVIGERRVMTYKCVLLARSEYFRALLSPQFGGEARSEIVIDSGRGEEEGTPDYDTFVGVLEFIFTGTIDRFVSRARTAKQRTQPSHDAQASSLSSSSLSSWWQIWWRNETRHADAKRQPPTVDEDGQRDYQDLFLTRVVALLAAATQYALFHLQLACEQILVTELERRTPSQRRQQQQRPASAPQQRRRRSPDCQEGEEEEEIEQGRYRNDDDELERDAIDLALPLLIVADTFACDQLRSSCLNLAALHTDAVRRMVRQYRTEIDARLLHDLFGWLGSA